jgi:GDP-4-dehydro-6-deoxy-D-mannose reductase
LRILVLGSSGFAGRWLCAELARDGHEVWGSKRPGSDPEVALSSAWVPDAALHGVVPCDLCDSESVRKAIVAVRPDAIVALAGMAFAPAAARDPAAAYRVHVLGTINVLQAAAALGPSTRVLIVTSSEIYGGVAAGDLPATENTPLRPANLYAASKASTDLTAYALSRSFPGHVIRVRPFNHTGPGQRVDFVCPAFASQVAAIARGEKPPILEVGNIDSVRDFSDVRDIVRGYAAALVSGKNGEVYNLCAGEGTTVRWVLETLCQVAGVRPEIRIDPARARPAEVPVLYGSYAKAEAELGWRPRIRLRETLEDLFGSFFEPTKKPAEVWR